MLPEYGPVYEYCTKIFQLAWIVGGVGPLRPDLDLVRGHVPPHAGDQIAELAVLHANAEARIIVGVAEQLVVAIAAQSFVGGPAASQRVRSTSTVGTGGQRGQVLEVVVTSQAREVDSGDRVGAVGRIESPRRGGEGDNDVAAVLSHLGGVVSRSADDANCVGGAVECDAGGHSDACFEPLDECESSQSGSAVAGGPRLFRRCHDGPDSAEKDGT